jgi:hypothetical protein
MFWHKPYRELTDLVEARLFAFSSRVYMEHVGIEVRTGQKTLDPLRPVAV